ncbi:MAG: TOBE domain-containing protein [Bryobacterales bacterium]|nr:TOBE domain-containing protein [Bryobacterales bacterium]
MQAELGITFVLVTHDQEEAMSLCQQVAILNHGKLEQLGSPRDLYLSPSSRFVAEFLGKVNWIDGIGVRPEAVRVATEAPPDGVRGIPATVEQATFLGNFLEVQSAVAGGCRVTAETSRLNGHYQRGDRVFLWWQPQDELHLSNGPTAGDGVRGAA